MVARHRPLATAAALALALLLVAAPDALACTSIIVGRGATMDGSLYLARTVDYSNALFTNNLRYSPARTTAAVFKSSVNQFSMTLPAPGLAYVAAPSTLVKGKLTMEEIGVNSRGVVVSTTQTIWSKNAALAVDPHVKTTGLKEDALASVLLPHPKATSAKATVQLLGSLIEMYGSGEGFGVHIADAYSAWYLESGGGHRWLAQRIPDSQFFVSANQGRFQTANFSDTANVLASPNLTEWAAAKTLWRPATGEFSFFDAFHAKGASDATANHPRVKRIQQRLGCYTDASTTGNISVFRPACTGKRISLADVTGALRDHYDGTAKDCYRQQTPKAVLKGNANEPWRPIAHLTTGYAHVTRVRASQPGPLRVINYLYQGTPAWTPAVPIYPLAVSPPTGAPADSLPTQLQGVVLGKPDAHSLFWKSRRLTALIFQDWPLLGPAVEKAIKDFDARVEAQRPAAEARWRTATLAKNTTGAALELAAFSRKTATEACALLDLLAAEAVQKLNLGVMPGDAKLQNWLIRATSQYLFNWR